MKQRRNQRELDPLPFAGAQLLAIAHGTGKDDYLSVVLVSVPDVDKYVVWTWNADAGGYGDGDYFSSFEFKAESNDEAKVRACKAAIECFNKRAQTLLVKSALWSKEDYA